ncbi:hypothetical protein PIB30_084487 [Stylosanthes scabra]|uniref:Uncharacterized protein n=1 Tax=Stylosanthes scabra TaxID=79078 RepID=A0ABU6VR27_9FABA|nr:hypothetical protein [Stylosanthes scabra]
MNIKYRTIANTARDSYKRCSTSTNFTTAETPTTKTQEIIPAGHLFLLCCPWVLHQGPGALRKGRLSRTRTVNYYSVNVRRTITGSSYAVTFAPRMSGGLSPTEISSATSRSLAAKTTHSQPADKPQILCRSLHAPFISLIFLYEGPGSGELPFKGKVMP